jgi:F0F1-type ATP synthase membrane subunit b/b'
MAIYTMKEVVPYAANFSIVVVMLALMLRKPARRFLYQRHERMKDAFEAAEIAHKKAASRVGTAKKAMEQAEAESREILAREKQHAEVEKNEILEKAAQESKQVLEEADRLVQVEQEEASDRVKEEFLQLVVGQAESSLKNSLKKDDHSAILKRAQNSIEVGV